MSLSATGFGKRVSESQAASRDSTMDLSTLIFYSAQIDEALIIQNNQKSKKHWMDLDV